MKSTVEPGQSLYLLGLDFLVVFLSVGTVPYARADRASEGRGGTTGRLTDDNWGFPVTLFLGVVVLPIGGNVFSLRGVVPNPRIFDMFGRSSEISEILGIGRVV